MTDIIDVIYLSGLFSFLIFLPFNKYRKSKKLLTIIYLESTIFIFTLLGVITYHFLKLENNLFLYHILAPIQYFFTSKLLILYISNIRFKNIIKFFSPLVIFLNLFFSILIQKLTEYNSYSLILNNLVIGVFSLLLLWETLNEFEEDEVYAKYWIAFGLFTNSFCAFFIQGFMNIFISNNLDFAFKLYIIEMLIYILSTFLILKAFCSEILFLKRRHESR